jgi:hypothetical protein
VQFELSGNSLAVSSAVDTSDITNTGFGVLVVRLTSRATRVWLGWGLNVVFIVAQAVQPTALSPTGRLEPNPMVYRH